MPLNILIAEDEEDIAEQYKMGFEDRGHKVTITYNGVECINVYRRARQTLDDEDPIIFDAVIIDHNMPLKNGAILAEEIRSINPEQTIVFELPCVLLHLFQIFQFFYSLMAHLPLLLCMQLFLHKIEALHILVSFYLEFL